FGGLLLVLGIYFVGVEEGALSIFNGLYVHEFVHDGRHLLGFPCPRALLTLAILRIAHRAWAAGRWFDRGALMAGRLLVRGMLLGLVAGLLALGFLQLS